VRAAERRPARCLAGGGETMSLRIFIARDSGALAVGADQVAVAFADAAVRRGLALEIVRTGSRGLYWLEPLVEVATSKGRVAYGPVTTADVPSVLDAVMQDGPHALALGLTEQVPWLRRQTR